MNSRSRLKTGVAALAAAAAVLGSVALLPGIADAAPGDPPAGPMTLTPPTGTSSSTFGLGIPAGATCPGDAPGGWQWSAIVVPSSADIGGLRFSASGLVQTPAGENSALYRSLRIDGVNLIAQNPNLVDGLINPSTLSTLNLSGAVLTPGTYNLAVACYNDGSLVGSTPLQTGRFYSAPITVTALAGAGVNNFTYAFGAVPSAPVLTTSSYDAATTTATVNLTHAASVPATTGYTATLTPVGAAAPIAPIAVPAGATSFQIPGVALGAEYTVSLVATNSTGASAASNTITVVGAATQSVVVNPIAAVFEGADVTISWTAPATAPTDYTVAIAGQPTITVAGTSTVVSGLAAGDYSVVVTPNYASGSGITGVASAPVSFTVQLNTLLYQDITVERPVGALVLTQRCGVFGGFGPFGTAGWPGAGLTLDPVVAVGGPGTAPTLVDAAGNDTGTPDPLFGSYPQRGTYPTLCGVNLGAAELATSGDFAGRFFVADGSINQVTVLDTRDGDPGWNARGDIADLFTTGSGPFDENNSFTGDFLGWFPQVTSTSTGQSVTAGSPVGPGTQNTPTVVGMTGNPTLASAPAGAGLGIATLDARLALLIPVAADADTYTARLSLTVA